MRLFCLSRAHQLCSIGVDIQAGQGKDTRPENVDAVDGNVLGRAVDIVAGKTLLLDTGMVTPGVLNKRKIDALSGFQSSLLSTNTPSQDCGGISLPFAPSKNPSQKMLLGNFFTAGISTARKVARAPLFSGCA